MIRYFGLYASSAKAKREQCQALLGNLAQIVTPAGERLADMVLFCQVCGEPARLTHSLWRGQRKGNSLIRESATIVVQQDDEVGFEKRQIVDTS